jgi:precorrin-6Y C5,15-methyltransferase (decarboxylating)
MKNDGRWLAILGIGADGVDGLSPRARALISDAALVVGGARHLDLAASLIRARRLRWPSPPAAAFPEILEHRGTNVVVLASGDPFWFGIGSLLARHVPMSEIFSVPAPSSAALACARLGWPLQDVDVVSACGRPIAPLIPLLRCGARILVLSADASTPASVAELLHAQKCGSTVMHVLEELGGPRERHRRTTASEFDLSGIQPLNLVALDVVVDSPQRTISIATGLPDETFAHDGQITKREIRAVSLSALAPRRGELLWDIGAGSGSIGIEWMLRHPSNRAIAIEADPTRAARVTANAENLGMPALRVIVGRAPEACFGLPSPDAVFIGGGAQETGVIEAAWRALRPDGRLVANAVTIETEAALIAASAEHGGTLTRLSVERMDRIGRMRAFRPAMTVTQWAATKN